MNMKRGQISSEYMIVVGFVVFVLIGLAAVAFYYTSIVGDEVKFSQLDDFTKGVIGNSESVFYSGEPSQLVINAYLPEGVREICIVDSATSDCECSVKGVISCTEVIGLVGDSLVLQIDAGGGTSTIGYESNVPISWGANPLGINSGNKRIKLTAAASPNRLLISEE
jgi:hypothetical protein